MQIAFTLKYLNLDPKCSIDVKDVSRLIYIKDIIKDVTLIEV